MITKLYCRTIRGKNIHVVAGLLRQDQIMSFLKFYRCTLLSGEFASNRKIVDIFTRLDSELHPSPFRTGT